MDVKADAVFEGGGVKGIGLVGAVQAAEERGYEWVNVAGTSAGAIVASLIAAGYTGRQLHHLLLDVNYEEFLDKDPLDRIPVIGPLVSFFLDLGLYEGDSFVHWLSTLLQARGVTKFGHLVIPEYADDLKYRYRLQVVASDLTNGRMLVLPQDAARYGLDPDELSVAMAVRMSMSIPFFYEPVIIYTHGEVGAVTSNVVVDGGILSNFPVWLFDSPGIPDWPTIGFKLTEPQEGKPHRIGGPLTLLKALFSTMMEAHDTRALEDQHYVRTIQIPTLGIGTTDFDLSPERAEELFRSGYEAALRFFDGWNFSSYVKLYRQDTSHHGRRVSL